MAKRFKATLVKDDGSSGCAFELPFDPKAVFGKARAPVRVTIGTHSFRTTTAPMSGAFWIPMSKSNRDAANVVAGDDVTVRVEFDDQPRVVEPPAALAKELRKTKRLLAAWDALSYTNQKEMAQSIDGAKREDTKERRLAKALETLRGR